MSIIFVFYSVIKNFPLFDLFFRKKAFIRIPHLLLTTGYLYFVLKQKFPPFSSYIFSLVFICFKFVAWRGFMISLHSSCGWAKGVVAEARVSTNTVEPVRLKLADRPRTFCPRVNIFTVKGQERNSIQFIDQHVSTEKFVDFKCFPENNLPRRVVLNKVMVSFGHAVYFGNLGEDFD